MSYPRRTKHFIDSNVQGALARRIILHWVVFLLVTAFVSFVIQVLANPFRPISDHFQDLWNTQGPFLLVMVFLLPVFVMDAIKLSHRFAGPIFSLRRAIQEIAQGNPARRLKFRTRDFWQSLADDFNAMLTKVGALDENATEDAEEADVVAAK
jgi:nitrogen fixation/metabolism regulation signal transduction histidine kinase